MSYRDGVLQAIQLIESCREGAKSVKISMDAKGVKGDGRDKIQGCYDACGVALEFVNAMLREHDKANQDANQRPESDGKELTQ